MKHDVDSFVFHECFRCVPNAFVSAFVAPRVFNDEVFFAVLVFSFTVNEHTVVVGSFPVFESLLTEFLSYFNFRERTSCELSALVLVSHTSPFSHVGASEFGTLSFVRNYSETVASETSFRNVRAPSESVAIVDSVVHNFEEFVDSYVVREGVTPVVFDFYSELSVEWVVSERCYRNVVVSIEFERFSILLWSHSFAIDSNFGRAFAKVSIVDATETVGPYWSEFVEFAFSDSVNVGFSNCVEFVVNREFFAIHDARHSVLRHETVVFHYRKSVGESTARSESSVAVEANEEASAFLHSVANDEHFREVDSFASEAENFGFEKTDRREAPASRRAVLVFDRSNRYFFDSCELEAFFVGFRFCFCCLSRNSDATTEHEG